MTTPFEVLTDILLKELQEDFDAVHDALLQMSRDDLFAFVGWLEALKDEVYAVAMEKLERGAV